jgi:hypothetical protein
MVFSFKSKPLLLLVIVATKVISLSIHLSMDGCFVGFTLGIVQTSQT